MSVQHCARCCARAKFDFQVQEGHDMDFLTDADKLYTLKECCELLGCRYETVRQYINEKFREELEEHVDRSARPLLVDGFAVDFMRKKLDAWGHSEGRKVQKSAEMETAIEVYRADLHEQINELHAQVNVLQEEKARLALELAGAYKQVSELAACKPLLAEVSDEKQRLLDDNQRLRDELDEERRQKKTWFQRLFGG
jgi:predicted nuclease with TOPRIM domain